MRWVGWAARPVAGTAAMALLLLAPARAGAQALAPNGPEFQVNTHTALFQELPSVAADADGNFVVVWSCDGASGTDTGSLSIQGQRYASDGSALGAQFQVNTYTTGDQMHASVTAEADGDFVVVWDSNGSNGPDTSFRSVQGQRYASDGSLQGAQFQVNTYTDELPDSRLRGGGCETGTSSWCGRAWARPGRTRSYRSIQGQRFDSVGAPQGAEFQINTYTTNYQRTPFVAADADGDFVVVWQSFGSSGTDVDGYSIQGQRYASDGSTQGVEFQVNDYTTLFQLNPSVAADADGDFVVVWHSYGSFGTDTSGFSVQGQRYASDGSLQGAQFQVNSHTTSDQDFSHVAAAADGYFVVVWDSAGSFGPDTSGDSIQGQRYAPNGSAQGAEFQVNTYTTSQQSSAFLAVAGDRVAVVWQSDGSPGSDTSNSSILGPALQPGCGGAGDVERRRFALVAALLLLGAVYALRRRS